MSVGALTISIVLYLSIAIDQFVKGQRWMALAFLAYAVANAGFALAAKGW